MIWLSLQQRVDLLFRTLKKRYFIDFFHQALPVRVGCFFASVKPGSVVEWNVGTALPYEVMQLVKEKDITLIFSYTYENKYYVVEINKDNIPEEKVPWYGPLYLDSLTKTSKAANEYVVKPGDTLNIIARKLNTTVEELLKKNPSIKNPNVIFAGKTLKY